MPPLTHSTYYDKNYRQTAALIRARQPYLIKNMIMGSALFAFSIGVYAMTIRAISQDDFSDVQIPDAPAQPAHAPNAGVERTAEPVGLGK